jgi:hypothetical protein
MVRKTQCWCSLPAFESIRLTNSNCAVGPSASFERPGARGEFSDSIDREICQSWQDRAKIVSNRNLESSGSDPGSPATGPGIATRVAFPVRFCPSISQKCCVYWWADGMYFSVRLDEERTCVLAGSVSPSSHSTRLEVSSAVCR